jgi:hypothetical protein
MVCSVLPILDSCRGLCSIFAECVALPFAALPQCPWMPAIMHALPFCCGPVTLECELMSS